MSWWSDMVRTYSNVLCGYIMIIYIYIYYICGGCTDTLHISINIHYIYAHIHFIPLMYWHLAESQPYSTGVAIVSIVCASIVYHPVWNGRPFGQGTLLFALSVPLLDWFKIKVRTRSSYLQKIHQSDRKQIAEIWSENQWQHVTTRLSAVSLDFRRLIL